jgi:sialate O-acetylesterase
MFTDAGAPDYKNWPFLREAQMNVFHTVKNTGIAVALDLGEYGNIHPVAKKPVGDRLAEQALLQVYHQSTPQAAFGPIYKDYMVQGENMYILLEYVFDGLTCTAEKLTGFEIAGEDRHYYPADAALTNAENLSFPAQLVLSSPNVKKPVYGRYCWTNYSEVTIFGKNGVPLAPFRTSQQDGATATGSRQGFLVE